MPRASEETVRLLYGKKGMALRVPERADVLNASPIPALADPAGGAEYQIAGTYRGDPEAAHPAGCQDAAEWTSADIAVTPPLGRGDARSRARRAVQDYLADRPDARVAVIPEGPCVMLRQKGQNRR